MTDWQNLIEWMHRPEVQAARARYAEPVDEAENIPVNTTVDDMEWEAEMVFGYDGWEDDNI